MSDEMWKRNVRCVNQIRLIYSSSNNFRSFFKDNLLVSALCVAFLTKLLILQIKVISSFLKLSLISTIVVNYFNENSLTYQRVV